jgi:ATP phosphoribosyltransferase regulatory subunit
MSTPISPPDVSTDLLNDVPATTPVGVRDFPPELAGAFYELQTLLVQTFTAQGYERVLTPTFELARVFERGLGPNEASRIMRFVDPQNGEVLAMRTDITPQIARMMAGALTDAPLPARLCYFGRVYRLRRHYEFQRREIAQAGIELIGADGVDADIEVLRLCDAALTSASPRTHTISIGHMGVLSAVLEGLEMSETSVAVLRNLLSKKDSVGVQNFASGRGVDAAHSQLLSRLCELYGHPDEVFSAVDELRDRIPAVAEPLTHLRSVVDSLNKTETGPRCLIDLGEMQGFGYYTGIVFHAYAEGIGQAVASGGRYNKLLGRYGRDLPAAGFAIDEEGLTEVRMRGD